MLNRWVARSWTVSNEWSKLNRAKGNPLMETMRSPWLRRLEVWSNVLYVHTHWYGTTTT